MEEACDISIYLADGRILTKEKRDYEGFHTRPASWEFVIEKFKVLSNQFLDIDLQNRIIEIVRHLEDHKVRDLTTVLAEAGVKQVT